MEKTVYSALGESVWHGRLPNGLHIYVDEKPEYGKQFAFFAACYGGMDLRFRTEDGHWRDTPAGVAHFLEHKLFDTEDGNALQDLAANGASPNAFTSSALTGYYFESTEKFCDNLKILLSFVSIPWFTQESVDKEQGIIGQEIRMYDDAPDWRVQFNLLAALYQNHPVRIDIAGTVESIAQIDAELLYRCYRTFYNLKNMVLTVAGKVTVDQVLAVADRMLKPNTPIEIERGFVEEPDDVMQSRV